MPKRHFQNIQIHTKRIVFDLDMRFPIVDVFSFDIFGSTFIAQFIRENPQPNIISVSPTFGETLDEVIAKMLDTQNQLVIVDDFDGFLFENGLLYKRIRSHPSNQFVFLDAEKCFGGYNDSTLLKDDFTELNNIYTLYYEDYTNIGYGKDRLEDYCKQIKGELPEEMNRILHRKRHCDYRYRKDKTGFVDYYEVYPLQVNAEDPFKAIPVDAPEDEKVVLYD